MRHIFLFILSFCIVATNNIDCSSKEELLEEELDAKCLEDEQKSQERFTHYLHQQTSKQQRDSWWFYCKFRNFSEMQKLYQQNPLLAQLKNKDEMTALAKSIRKNDTKFTDALLQVMLQRWNKLRAYEEQRTRHLNYYNRQFLFHSVHHFKKDWRKTELNDRVQILREFPGIIEAYQSTTNSVLPSKQNPNPKK